MTTTPDTVAVDHALAERAVTSADMLTGVLAAATLDVLGQPTKLPTVLWPDVPPEVVTAIYEHGLRVGYRAGRIVSAPTWEPEALDRLRTALADAGYRAMTRQVAVTASHGRHHTGAEVGVVRGEHE
ncbi:hypothetical protein ACFW81_24090 [Streptomyces angustmyceticus]|uniref:hypothetical protein n=1 Tax=Streptomyces angustmyceticus TaxID=285578 RepID=UPI0036A36311